MVWLLAVLLVGALIALIGLGQKKRALDAEVRRAREERAPLDQRMHDLFEENAVLRKYRQIVDADARAHEVVQEAERAGSKLVAQAQAQAEALLAETRNSQVQVIEEATAARERATAMVATATAEARRLVAEAEKRAQETAGAALAAVKNAEHYRETVQAMKNVIEGYGDRYIVPTHSLLDDLADAFGFTEAGQRLKSARERTRSMIKAGTAADCDYVEDFRRKTAADFVTDAFNGKVETILADARKDNHGTLEQRIRDAFALVNHNGRAFRDARITADYLEARLDELKWAVVANELKDKEREEQRAIRERIKEEEKAQREFERAMKEAAKEEGYLRKAMEKAQKEIEQASDAQKAKYEEQLRQLGEQLKAAEEKNKRALSMAQQTRSGNVYIISNVGSFGEDVFKIGLTRRLEPEDRIRELGDASVPFGFDIHAMIKSDDAPALEHELHKLFVRHQMNKVNARKEFFRVPLRAIREEVERIGYQAQWTMAAACQEFKETLAIERAMQEGTFSEGDLAAWQIREPDVDDDAQVA